MRITKFVGFCIFLVIAMSACSSSQQSSIATTPTKQEPKAVVQGSSPREEVQSIEIDNCNGKADLKRIEVRSQSVNVTLSAEVAAKLGASVEVISAEVQTVVGLSVSKERGKSTSVELTAPPKTRMLFQIIWIGDEQIGVVQNLRGSDIPIVFRNFSPTDFKMKSQDDIGCAGVISTPKYVVVSPTQAQTIVTTQVPAGQNVAEDKNPKPQTIDQPTSIKKGKLLQEFNFDSAVGWEIKAGDTEIGSGNLILYSENDAYLNGTAQFTDFVFESSFFVGEAGDLSFFMRHQRPPCSASNSNCSIQIGLYFDRGNSLQQIAARRYLGDKGVTDIVSNRQLDGFINANQQNKITIFVKGSVYRVYINDVFVLDFTDATYSKGSFVLNYSRGESRRGLDTLKIDYIRVYATE